MALKTTYNSTRIGADGGLLFEATSTQNAAVAFSSQVMVSDPVATASTSVNNMPFGQLTLTGSSSSALVYKLDPPVAPYGQQLKVTCLNTSTSTRQSLWLSTDGSVTFEDGTNCVAVFTSSGGSPVSNKLMITYVSSQRAHATGFSTTNLLFSTQSS